MTAEQPANATVDRVFADNFAAAWIEAWNARDLPRILGHYTDDFQMASPRIVEVAGEASGVLRGKEAVGVYWRKALDRSPDLRFELIAVFTGSQSVAIHYRNQTGRLAVETFEFAADGRVARAAAHYA